MSPRETDLGVPGAGGVQMVLYYFTAQREHINKFFYYLWNALLICYLEGPGETDLCVPAAGCRVQGLGFRV